MVIRLTYDVNYYPSVLFVKTLGVVVMYIVPFSVSGRESGTYKIILPVEYGTPTNRDVREDTFRQIVLERSVSTDIKCTNVP